jgi:regulator of protease activity HflC (stomatin/prohibitin superfamily)
VTGGLLVVLVLAIIAIVVVARTAVVVPQQSAFVVERLGRYSGSLNAGFHILVPFVDAVRYKHSLKEAAIDIPEQICITRDNVQVGVDGVLYMKVLNPERASYGINDYRFAITQLAQTTLRSEMGKIDLDKTFEERTTINMQVVGELDKATEPWGVKVLRYEIKNITPPKDVLAAMEKQMRAEREKRATVLTSEGQRDAAINNAEGQKQQTIKASEAKKQQQINEAEGQASAILAIAEATAEGIRKVADVVHEPGGYEAVQLRVAEQYIGEFGKLARQGTTMVVPATLTDVSSMIGLAMNVIKNTAGGTTTGGGASGRPVNGSSAGNGAAPVASQAAPWEQRVHLAPTDGDGISPARPAPPVPPAPADNG